MQNLFKNTEAQIMKDSGKMISLMARELRSSLTPQSTKGRFIKVPNTVMANTTGLISQCIPATGKTTNFQVRENISGLMEGCILESGKKI